MEDDNRDPRRPGTISENATVDLRWALGARFREGGRTGVGATGGAGYLVVVNNPPPPPMVHDQVKRTSGGRRRYDEDNDEDGSRLDEYCAHRALHVTSVRTATMKI